MRPTLHVTVGIPGCGKSTWANALALEEKNTLVVSSDAIREEIVKGTRADFYKLDPPPIQLAFDIYHARIWTALLQEIDVVADATNLHGFARDRLLEIAKLTGAFASCRLWPRAYEGRERNRRRTADIKVPDEAMARMEQQLVAALNSVADEPWGTIKRVNP